MTGVALIGCGFVADLYMRSFRTFPSIQILGVHDHDSARLERFAGHWGVRAFTDLPSLLAELPRNGLVLNLTNPTSHVEVTRACLHADRHVWSEKPMALSLDDARELHDLASERGLILASAPSSVLSEAAQTLAKSLREERIGTPRLIYAELDDGYLTQAPVDSWVSESGAPWPLEDELRTGCTLEHAGYWLSWLIASLGPIREVASATATAIPNKRGVVTAAPDVSVALLHFVSGPVARLTCSIVAPHDHSLRIIGDDGILEVPRAWDNSAPVRLRRRLRIRRRLFESPISRRERLAGPTHPKVKRQGAAAMNFALGPVEVLEAIAMGRPSRLGGAFALHLTEATLAINAGGVHPMRSSCEPLDPMSWAR